MIRVSHVSLQAGLNALARRGPADELTVYVSDALPPDRQRAAVRIALRASRRAGWRALLPAPSVALLLASGMTWLRRAASALRAHSVAWGTASAVLAAASTAVYFAAAPHQHGSVGLAPPPAPAVSRSPAAIPSQPGHTSPRPAVGEDVGGRAAGSAEAAGHRGRTADVRAKTSAEWTVVARPDTKRLAIPGAKPSTHGQRPRLHQGAWHPDVPARGALVPRPPSAICRPLLVGFAARPPPARSAIRLAAVPVRQYLRRPAARSGRVR